MSNFSVLILIAQVLLTSTISGYSQDVSILLSIEFREEANNVNLRSLRGVNTSIKVPFLKVEYINKTTDSIYLRNIVSSRSNFLRLPSESQSKIRRDIIDRINHLPGHNDDYFQVLNGNYPFLGSFWELHRRDNNTANWAEMEIISRHISSISQVLETQQLLDSFSTKLTIKGAFLDCCKNEVSYQIADSIVSQYRKNPEVEFHSWHFENAVLDSAIIDEFIFLAPGEIRREEKNLLPFFLLRGHYEFKILNNESRSYVEGDSYFHKRKNKWCQRKILLPKRVGHYELFTGYFATSSAKLDLP